MIRDGQFHPDDDNVAAEIQQYFDELKKKLTSSKTLMCPDTDKQFTLQTDASDNGIGAVLSQYNDENVEKLVAFYPRKLLSRERAYSTVGLESLALINAVQHFRVYLRYALLRNRTYDVNVILSLFRYNYKWIIDSSCLESWLLL